jgi:hypothetical protein
MPGGTLLPYQKSTMNLVPSMPPKGHSPTATSIAQQVITALEPILKTVDIPQILKKLVDLLGPELHNLIKCSLTELG